MFSTVKTCILQTDIKRAYSSPQISMSVTKMSVTTFYRPTRVMRVVLSGNYPFTYFQIKLMPIEGWG